MYEKEKMRKDIVVLTLSLVIPHLKTWKTVRYLSWDILSVKARSV